MGKAHLIGDKPGCLIPAQPPQAKGDYQSPRRKNSAKADKRRKQGQLLTQHTGLPPRSLKGSKKKRPGTRKPR